MPDGHWFLATATSACVASVFVCVFMSPFDVAATRVYNQPIDKVSLCWNSHHIKFIIYMIYKLCNIISHIRNIIIHTKNPLQVQHIKFSMAKEHFTTVPSMPL